MSLYIIKHEYNIVPGGQISTQFQWETQELPTNQCEQGCVERTHLAYLLNTGLASIHFLVSLKSELHFGLVKKFHLYWLITVY